MIWRDAPRMPKVDTFSYASEDDTAFKRLVIQVIERMSGQPELKRLYLEHQNDPRPGEKLLERGGP